MAASAELSYACGEPGAGPYSVRPIRLGPDRLEAAIQQGGAPVRSSKSRGCAANRHTLPWGFERLSHAATVFQTRSVRGRRRPRCPDEQRREPFRRSLRAKHVRHHQGQAEDQTAEPDRVLILNDDYTPMEFVVHVLEKFFQKDAEAATKIMLHVHHHGIGECRVFTYEIAETKVTQVMDFARKHQHPLQCVMEKK